MIRKLAIITVIVVGQIFAAESSSGEPAAGATEATSERTRQALENLNLVGADIHMPPFSDTGLRDEYRLSPRALQQGLRPADQFHCYLFPEHIECARAFIGPSIYWRT